MPYLLIVYVAYVGISLPLIVWLARTLARNGAVFLEDVFKDEPRLAEAVNRLLVVGFYLVCLGYCAMLVQSAPPANAPGAFETLASKLGVLLFSLGGMHFLNLYVLHRIRRRSKLQYLPPPVAAHMHLDPVGQ